MQLSRGQYPGPVRCYAQEIGDARLVDRHEGIEDGCYEQGTASVRLEGAVDFHRVWFFALPHAVCVERSERVAQRSMRPGSLPKLLGELREQIFAGQVAARPGDLLA